MNIKMNDAFIVDDEDGIMVYKNVDTFFDAKMTKSISEVAKSNRVIAKTLALIVGHGDLDGIISTVMVYDMIRDEYDRIEVVFSQPFWLGNDKNIKQSKRCCDGDLSIYDKIYVVDIAINNRKPSVTLDFINRAKGKVVWYDHHKGWSNYNIHQIVDCKFYINENAKSCVSLIKRVHSKRQWNDKIEMLVELADLTDQGEGDNMFNKALKINLKNNETRYEVFRFGIAEMGGELEKYSMYNLAEKEKKYKEMEKNTLELLRQRLKITGGVGFIDMRDRRQKPIDKTLLFFEAYKKVPYVILRFLTKENGQECMTIATSTRKNLVKTFRLPSGQPYRITLYKPKYTPKEIIKMLTGK